MLVCCQLNLICAEELQDSVLCGTSNQSSDVKLTIFSQINQEQLQRVPTTILRSQQTHNREQVGYMLYNFAPMPMQGRNTQSKLVEGRNPWRDDSTMFDANAPSGFQMQLSGSQEAIDRRRIPSVVKRQPQPPIQAPQPGDNHITPHLDAIVSSKVSTFSLQNSHMFDPTSIRLTSHPIPLAPLPIVCCSILFPFVILLP